MAVIQVKGFRLRPSLPAGSLRCQSDNLEEPNVLKPDDKLGPKDL